MQNNNVSEEMPQEQAAQLWSILDNIVFVMADMVENRDGGTGGHIERMSSYIRFLVQSMIKQDVYAVELKKMDLETLYSSACLHDVGKINIPDIILSKPARLTNEEFQVMKTHTMEGERIIKQIIARAGESEFLRNARIFAGYHHERWDGKGYPRGLDRLNIPLQGRIMAIIDVYDALVSERPYKKPFTPAEAVKIIMDSTGEMFDPLIAEAFYEARNQFENIKS